MRGGDGCGHLSLIPGIDFSPGPGWCAECVEKLQAEREDLRKRNTGGFAELRELHEQMNSLRANAAAMREALQDAAVVLVGITMFPEVWDGPPAHRRIKAAADKSEKALASNAGAELLAEIDTWRTLDVTLDDIRNGRTVTMSTDVANDWMANIKERDALKVRNEKLNRAVRSAHERDWATSAILDLLDALKEKP